MTQILDGSMLEIQQTLDRFESMSVLTENNSGGREKKKEREQEEEERFGTNVCNSTPGLPSPVYLDLSAMLIKGKQIMTQKNGKTKKIK